jgi:hypothetical protein
LAEVKTIQATGKPYRELLRTGSFAFREFSADIPEEELVWHRDKEDRLLETDDDADWFIQLDNELPKKINKTFIPKGVYHRLIKGKKTLRVIVNFL